MPAAPRILARALLLGERLDHRGLPREGAPTFDPVPLATPEGFTAFVDTLSQPGRPVPEMVDVLARTAPWEMPRDGER